MNKVAIITGGTRGIGNAIVYELCKKGINIVLNYKNSDDLAIKIKEELGDKVEIFKGDVSDRNNVKELVSFTMMKFGTIDILINNAGISHGEKIFLDITENEWNEIININLTSCFHTIQEVLPVMIHNKSGCIINISSVYGITGGSCEVPYSVSKAGIDGLTKSLAKELGPSNIRVNSVAPGLIDTDMNNNLSKEDWEALKTEIPLNKIGKPVDIARCVSWLVDDEFTTGQVISPNGGWVIT